MWQRWYLVLSFSLILVGCGGKTYAPVSDRSLSSVSAPSPSEYIVRKGDTLYSIAFRYGLDYRQLAIKNNIGARYSIYPGQRLRLKSASPPAASESIVRDSSIVAPKPVITSTRTQAGSLKPSSSKSQSVAPQSKTAQKTAVNSSRAANSTTPKPKPRPKPVTDKPTKKIQTKLVGPIKWKWPVSGRVIGTFKTKGLVNKGVNIAGSRGKTIAAAADGKVVYAGNGLLGYGNLVIVDHNQQFLSAYAHNSRVLVKENDMVKTGQKIAEMGSSGADRVMLHFEIRRDGKPVNPLKYLPKR